MHLPKSSSTFIKNFIDAEEQESKSKVVVFPFNYKKIHEVFKVGKMIALVFGRHNNHVCRKKDIRVSVVVLQLTHLEVFVT